MSRKRSRGFTAERRFARRPVRAAGVLCALAATFLIALSSGSTALGAVTVRAGEYGTVYEHLSYGPRIRQNLDVFVSSTPHAPAVMLVHGGGWHTYDALVWFQSYAQALQAQGFTVFLINYDQDNEGVPAFPLEPNEVTAASRWALSNAATYNADPSKFVLLGGSAGGHLVSLVAEQLDAEAPGTVKGVITLSGPTDFRTLVPMVEAHTLTNETFNNEVMMAVGREANGRPYLYANPVEEEAYEAKWSPALHPPAAAACPKWLIFHSEAEMIPLSQAETLNNKLHEAGCASTLRVLPGARHAFQYFNEQSPQIFSFIRGL